MDNERIGLLEKRFAQMERQNKRLRRMSAAFACLLGVGFLTGAQVIKDSLVVNEQLLIVDRAGTVRFDLGVEKTKGLANGLILYDKGP